MRASGSAQVRASKYVAVTKDRGHRGRVDGGVVIELPAITSAEEWCEFYGVEVVDGVATLFKAVDDDFKSGYGFAYTPGTAPEAPDWDGGKAECGGGLHFSPLPFLAAGFHREATRYVACPVSLEDIAVHEDAVHPSKVKARRVCAPCYECDIDGEALECAEKSA